MENDFEFEQDIPIDTIIDIYQDIKDRCFILNPFFMKNLKSIDLTEYIIENILKNNRFTIESSEKKAIVKFKQDHLLEIDCSFNIISTFKQKIQYNDWVIFCYKVGHRPHTAVGSFV